MYGIVLWTSVSVMINHILQTNPAVTLRNETNHWLIDWSIEDLLLPHAVNCGRFCFWRRQSVVFVCVWNIFGTAERICAKFTRKTCLVPRSDEFEALKVKVKGQGLRGQKRHVSALSAACVRFMFGKISLTSSLLLLLLLLLIFSRYNLRSRRTPPRGTFATMSERGVI